MYSLGQVKSWLKELRKKVDEGKKIKHINYCNKLINTELMLMTLSFSELGSDNFQLIRQLTKDELKSLTIYKLGEIDDDYQDFDPNGRYDDPKLNKLKSIASKYALDKNAKLPVKTTIPEERCRCISFTNRDAQCEFKKSERQCCKVHHDFIFLLTKSINIPRCSEFYTIPRCLRSAPLTDTKCNTCKLSNDRRGSRIEKKEIDFNNELRWILEMSKTDYEDGITTLKDKLSEIKKMNGRDYVYCGITNRNGFERHANITVLPRGSLIKDVVIFPNKLRATSAEAIVVQYAKSLFGKRCLNRCEGGQQSSATDISEHVVYLGLVPAEYAKYSSNYNKPADTLIPVVFGSSSENYNTSTDFKDIDILMGMKLIRKIPQNTTLQLIGFLGELFIAN
jgi:hypothetical protein